jgi:hypothetical protein
MNQFKRDPFYDYIRFHIPENITLLRNLINAQYMLRFANNDSYISDQHIPTFCTQEDIKNALELIDNE